MSFLPPFWAVFLRLFFFYNGLSVKALIGFLPVLGRTLPPLFRTVRRVVRILLTRTLRRFLRRVWQISAKGWTSTEFCESPKFEGSTEFCERLNFCSTDFCETKADVSAEFCENVYFLFGRFLRNKVAGLALALIFGLSPLSVCEFLLMCCFWPVNAGAVALILLTRARCVKQAGAAYTVPIITYGTYQ